TRSRRARALPRRQRVARHRRSRWTGSHRRRRMGDAVRTRLLPLRARGRNDGVVVPRDSAAIDRLVPSRMVGLTMETTWMGAMTGMTGAFKTMHWEEKPYDAATGQPALMHAATTHELTGDIEGEVSITYLMGYAANGMARFVGLARVTGRVAERVGSFVMQDV